ncbi:histidine protein methyltransferase 1 homolog isoform X2 [Periplaneta americana]
MFKFNFPDPYENKDENAVKHLNVEDVDSSDREIEWFTAHEMFPLQVHIEENIRFHMFTCGKYEIKHMPFQEGIKQLSNISEKEEISEAEILHSDLLPAKYEGGLKVWECTRDLADYLLQNNIYFSGMKVLDLGCGVGLLGILAMYLKAESVHFQDYNSSVISAVTMPNVLKNKSKLEQDGILQTNRFFAGDWKSFVDLVKGESSAKENNYDIILTSETIYNPANQSKLLRVFKECLKPGGVIYLAAKTHYFGVGGGTRQFENMLAEDDIFHSQVCWKCSEGVQREILKINFHQRTTD